jgi:hypothetical protein
VTGLIGLGIRLSVGEGVLGTLCGADRPQVDGFRAKVLDNGVSGERQSWEKHGETESSGVHFERLWCELWSVDYES